MDEKLFVSFCQFFVRATSLLVLLYYYVLPSLNKAVTYLLTKETGNASVWTGPQLYCFKMLNLYIEQQFVCLFVINICET